MTSIESLGHPIVYKVAADGSVIPRANRAPGERPASAIRVELRSLEGMQKEAIVSLQGGAVWRMVCDEGPYLNGTDLAPFPLAFFTAGQQFDLLSKLVAGLRAEGRSFRSIVLEQDNYYAMNGSFLRGNAVGSAMSPEVRVRIDGDERSPGDRLPLDAAVSAAPSHALLHEPMWNRFSLTSNGRPVMVDRLMPCEGDLPDDPRAHFDAIRPAESSSFLPDIIRKTESADIVRGVEGGAGSSLQPEQKRVLHIRGAARLADGMIAQSDVQLLKPIGSRFRFLCDVNPRDDGGGPAPPPLAFLFAGIGFCYMTQLGRYAHIAKLALDGYRVVQDGRYVPGDRESTGASMVLPLETHVFVDSGEPEDVVANLVRVGEQTCFLHGAMRGSHPASVSVCDE